MSQAITREALNNSVCLDELPLRPEAVEGIEMWKLERFNGLLGKACGINSFTWD